MYGPHRDVSAEGLPFLSRKKFILRPQAPLYALVANLLFSFSLFSFLSSVPVGDVWSLFVISNLIIRVRSAVSGFLTELSVFFGSHRIAHSGSDTVQD